MKSWNKKITTPLGQLDNANGLQLAPIFNGLENSFPIGITDLTGKLIYVNDPLVNMWGYAHKNEIVGKSLVEFWDGDRIFKTIKDLKTKGYSTGEDRGKKKDGSVFDVQYVAILCKNNDGRPQYMLGQFFDITKRKQAMHNLREAKERYYALFDQAPDAIAVIDLETRKFFAYNKKLCQHLGYSSEEIINLSPFDIEANETEEEMLKHMEKIDRKGGDVFETKHITKQGEIRDVLVSARHIRFGSKTLIQGVFTDISERKQTEQKVLENVYFLESMDRVNRVMQKTNNLEQMMRDILDEVISIFNCDRAFFLHFVEPDLESWIMPIARWRPAYPIAYSNIPVPLDPLAKKIVKAMVDSNEPVKAGPGTQFPLTKYVSETFKFKSFMGMILYPKTENLWELGIHQCSQDRIFTANEEKLFKEIAIRLTDTLTSFLMYRTLQESEKKYRTMMESFADPLYIGSSDFTVEYMNPAMLLRTGRNATGEKCYYALHGLGSQCDWCIFDKVTSGKTIETNIKSPLDNRNYRITNMPVRNLDGSISKMSIFRDITDYLEAVSEKEKAQAQLNQSQKMESIGNLAGGIAHDFNNILACIMGFTELALDDAAPGTNLEENLMEVFVASKRAKDLVAQILTFARQTNEEAKPVRIGLIAKKCLKLLQPSLPPTIRIKEELNSDASVLGNATLLEQCMVNLATNAMHAMEPKGGILALELSDVKIDDEDVEKYQLSKPGNYIKLTISDTGVGISKDIIPSIFEPYFTTKELGKGTGMGLAIAHGTIKKYGGTIRVESSLGQGTAFTILLPTTNNRETDESYLLEELPHGTERILFIDDEFSITKICKRILQKPGYQVTTRTSSIEALELFKKRPNDFDLVVTDMTMPNLTGDKLAVELIKIRRNIPVILCTGYSNLISDETAAEIGIKAFAYKPIIKADLVTTVRKVLDEAKGNTEQ